MPTPPTLAIVPDPDFPEDRRDLDAPHRRLLAPLADLLVAATEAAREAGDAPSVERLDRAWLLVVAAAIDTRGGRS